MDSQIRVNLVPVLYGNISTNVNPTIIDIKYKIKIKPKLKVLSKSVSVQLETINNYNNDKEKLDEEKGWRKYTGLMLAVQSSFVFSLTALIVKYFDNHNPISISLWRFQGILWPSIPLFILNQLNQRELVIEKKLKSEFVNVSKFKVFVLLMTRSITACNSFVLNFYSLKYLEIGDALAIASSTPVFVTLFAHYFLGEKCGIVPILTAILTIFGVVVIARPPHLTGEEGFDFDTLIGTAMSLGCMLLGTMSFVLLRYLRKIHYSEITLAFGVWGTFENLLLATFFGVLSFPEGAKEWSLAFLLLILSLFGQLSIIFALKKELAGPVAFVRTCDVVFAFGWQIAFLGRLPNLFSLIGATIIIFGIFLTALRKWLNELPDDHISRRRFQFLLM